MAVAADTGSVFTKTDTASVSFGFVTARGGDVRELVNGDGDA